jgi:5'(3')-deoxyribonucleotidase
MDKPYVLLDIDGVILNWDFGIDNYIKSHVPDHMQPEFIDEHAYDLMDRYGFGLEEANQIVWDFHTHESFAEIPALPGVSEALVKLVEHFDLVAITACGDDDLIVKYRKQNLHSLFPRMFKEIICTNSGLAKQPHLAKFPPSYWIEDHTKNAHLGKQFGHVCMLVDAPYNREDHLDQVIRVLDLPAAVEIILSLTHSKVCC